MGVICKKYDYLETPCIVVSRCTNFPTTSQLNNKGWDFTGEILLTVTALKVKLKPCRCMGTGQVHGPLLMGWAIPWETPL
jgi:hypothetical protein